MRIALVCMPWHSVDRPSLALGIVRRIAADHSPDHEVTDVYASLRWAEFMFERSHGAITPFDYFRVSDIGVFLGMGDWIFAPALYGTDVWKVEEYSSYLTERGIDPQTAVAMQRLAPDFVHRVADQILTTQPDMVGFTTTFMQNIPSLALARVLKSRRPDLITVFGGGNCDGVMGEALHRNYPFLDYVVRGEGEQTFRELLDVLARPAAMQTAGADGAMSSDATASSPLSLSDISGLCWRSDAGDSVVNADRSAPCPVSEIPEPEFDSYFDALAHSPLRDQLEPKIVLEGARGCWWGAKHQCTFCGLNGSLMAFRAKSPERVYREIMGAIERYRALDIIMVDNIIDMRYFKSLLPRLAESDVDFKIHYEVKSNLSPEQVRVLGDARIWHIQPGIESLSSRVLDLMRKGVSGVQNVQLLRDGEENDLTISWNYLYGFPGEEESDYAHIVEQMPSLIHLQPPQSIAPIALERFSPNFDDPSFGFADRRPADFYGFAYDLPESELAGIAYIFGTPPQGISGEIVERMEHQAGVWRELYATSSLACHMDGDALVVEDRRADRPAADYRFDDPVQIAIYSALRRRLSLAGLAQRLAAEGIRVPADAVEAFLRELRRLGLVFEDAGSFVALAIPGGPRRSAPSISTGIEAAIDVERLGALLATRELLPPHLTLRAGAGECWPDDNRLADLHRLGVTALTIAGHRALGDADPLETLAFLRFLRDVTAHRIDVRWSGWLGDGLTVSALSHLPPPAAGAPAWSPALITWRRAFASGSFTWRRGASFLLIESARRGQETQLLLDGKRLQIFEQCQTPIPTREFEDDAACQAALSELLRGNAVVQLGGYLLALPCRLRRQAIAVQRYSKKDATLGPWIYENPADDAAHAGRREGAA
jgi:ribosomal peptide maturation radical SAM protein 1